MTTFTNTTDQVESIYVGYFGRAGDPSGTNYWVGQRNAGTTTLSQLAASFAVQPEATSKYPYLANPNIANPTEFINQVYQNLFNRAADAAGLAYWTAQLTAASGNPTAIGNFILNVISGATGTDSTFITNKVDVAKDFTTKATNANTAWTATVQSQSINEIIATTTDASVVTQKAATDTFIASAPGPALDLTVNTDTLASGATNASFNGALFFNAPSGTFFQTLTTGDNLTATGTGASMTAVLNTAATAVTTTGIARMELANAFGAAALTGLGTGITGVTTLSNVASTTAGLLTVGATGGGGLKTALTTMNVTGSAVVGATSALIAAAALTGTADALAINVTGAFGTAAAPLQMAFGTDGTAGTVAAVQNSYETVNLSTTAVTGVNLGGVGAAQSTTTLNITGAGLTTVHGGATDNFSKLTTINASTQTGGVTITGDTTAGTGLLLNTTNVLTSFKGGTGVDSLDISNFTAAQVQAFTATNLDGGLGRDTLILGAAAAQTTTALNATGFEIISLAGATSGTYDISKLGTGVDSIAFASATAATAALVVTNATNGFTVTGTGGFLNTNPTLNITGPTGAADALTMTLADIAAATEAFGATTFAGYETITATVSAGTGANGYTFAAIAATPTAGSVTTFNLIDNDAANAVTLVATNVGTGSLIITGTGTAGIAATGVITASVINASGLNTAGLTTATGLNMTAAAAAAVIITGSNGVDTILGSAAADTISVGTGNDFVTGNELGDTINVGTGTDRIIMVNNTDTSAGVIASGAALLAATGTDIVTGMGTGDSVSLAGVGLLDLANGAITVSTTFATATADLVTIVTGSYATGTGVFTAGVASTTNNDYLVQYNGGATTTTVNTVVLVDVVGTVTATSAAEIITLTVA